MDTDICILQYSLYDKPFLKTIQFDSHFMQCRGYITPIRSKINCSL